MKLRPDLEADFQSELAHSPENIVTACDMLNQIKAGTFYASQKAAGAKVLGEDIQPLSAERQE